MLTRNKNIDIEHAYKRTGLVETYHPIFYRPKLTGTKVAMAHGPGLYSANNFIINILLSQKEKH